MKVAFLGDLIDNECITGQARYAYYLITGLANHGVDVTLLYSDLPGNSIFKNIKKDKYRIGQIPLINEYIKSKLANYKAGKFDVFHDTTNYGMPLGRSKAKKIISLHDIGTARFPQYYRDYTKNKMNLVEKILINTDAVITASEFQKKEISELYNISENKIFVVCHGIDTSKFTKTKDARLIDKEYVMYLGNLVPKKGIHYLLRAFNLIKNKIPHKLLLVGIRGFQSDTVFAMIDDLGLGSRVIVRENAEDNEIINYLSYASLFVYPSLYEGFGLPPLEAMACGAPVITSNNTSLAEIYKDSAILVDPENVNELGDSIVTVLTDARLAEELILKGYNKVEQFPWNNTIKATLKVYEKVTGTF
ncbi:MAG: glycosyltransferase family 4 protein [Thermodesulfobacteriota bacterium]